MNAPLGSVSYHVRVLADLGALQLVDQAPRRGAIEHHYALAPGLRMQVLNPALDYKAREDGGLQGVRGHATNIRSGVDGWCPVGAKA